MYLTVRFSLNVHTSTATMHKHTHVTLQFNMKTLTLK